MLNYLWGAMIIIGIVFGAFNGTMTNITSAALDSAREAVELCITMVGIMGVWVGLMRIAEVSGIIKAATDKIKPFVDFMFPDIPKDHKAREYITTNIIANVLGLGWAATPAGLMAMQSLKELNKDSEVASIDMCTFLIINISSLQIIPINIIAYRSQYGSVNPTIITAPAIVATTISTLVGVSFAKIMAVRHR
ncbi:MAG: nucleoside recognition domain-containing protein [Lachnotalea sp.]